MSKEIRSHINLSNIRSAYSEVADLYDLRELDVERIFLDAVSSFFKTDDYWFSGDGLWIKSRANYTPYIEDVDIYEEGQTRKRTFSKTITHVGYKTLSKKEFRKLYKLFISMVKRERIDKQHEYVEAILQANNNILSCEKIAYI